MSEKNFYAGGGEDRVNTLDFGSIAYTQPILWFY